MGRKAGTSSLWKDTERKTVALQDCREGDEGVVWATPDGSTGLQPFQECTVLRLRTPMQTLEWDRRSVRHHVVPLTAVYHQARPQRASR